MNQQPCAQQKMSRGKYYRNVRFVKVIHNEISVYFSISLNSLVTLRIFFFFMMVDEMLSMDATYWIDVRLCEERVPTRCNHEEHDETNPMEATTIQR